MFACVVPMVDSLHGAQAVSCVTSHRRLFSTCRYRSECANRQYCLRFANPSDPFVEASVRGHMIFEHTQL